ncbi:MAG TPA: LLM class flavin-dependent oxidoreductase [Alphaproteobacteria bacterium]|nr:LLM class flavin-dependent oxidoreductase [Alphaproteobacteria bacterium]
MGLQFGVFDHIEPVPGLSLGQIYRERLQLLERYDAAGFYAYHLAEHHTPAVHSLAPSQNVFLAAASQRTQRLRLAPCVYVLPLHHPLRLIEEICMLDHLSGGRLEVGVGRGGVLEAYFWGSDADVERNQARFLETLAILKEGLSHDQLTFKGECFSFDALPMRLRPVQQPYPPMWYMRNVETAARDGMHTVIVGSLDSFEANVLRYRQLWEEYHGVGARTVQGLEPKIGLVNHIVLAPTDAEAVAIAKPAWGEYVWNLEAPRRLEAEQRGLTQFLGGNMNRRPAGLPSREPDFTRYRLPERSEEQRRRRTPPGNIGGDGRGAGFSVIAGKPDSIRTYMDEYVATGANYFVCSFQWGGLTHDQAMRSIDLFVEKIMPHYA